MPFTRYQVSPSSDCHSGLRTCLGPRLLSALRSLPPKPTALAGQVPVSYPIQTLSRVRLLSRLGDRVWLQLGDDIILEHLQLVTGSLLLVALTWSIRCDNNLQQRVRKGASHAISARFDRLLIARGICVRPKRPWDDHRRRFGPGERRCPRSDRSCKKHRNRDAA